MKQHQSTYNISVTWRGKKFVLEMNSGSTLKELGHELQKLTAIKADTMRLIVPQASNRSSKLLYPFSVEQSSLSLQEASLFEGKFIRMMGVPKDEVDEVIQNAKKNLRIAGFEEEERRMTQRMFDRPHASLKLPQGPYIFCEFRTLHIPGVEWRGTTLVDPGLAMNPGACIYPKAAPTPIKCSPNLLPVWSVQDGYPCIQLNPPASEALKRMHILASDPGIVAIMNKHHWRVGIMTEMAPEGYVGVSPKCILGFNKNHGEEISLRLRTDDLKGFRKYESIKKTLLHELAHMVYAEHDANFYALDKQLNQEAATLDWTRSKSHTLSGVRYSDRYEEEIFFDNNSSFSHKLGGMTPDHPANARATSVAAAYHRLANTSTDLSGASEVRQELDPGDFGLGVHQAPGSMDVVGKGKLIIENPDKSQWKDDNEPDPDACQNKFEPDPDDIDGDDAMESEPYSVSGDSISISEPDPDDSQITQFLLPLVNEKKLAATKVLEEPDPDGSEACLKDRAALETSVKDSKSSQMEQNNIIDEPDPDASELKRMGYKDIARPDQDVILAIETMERKSQMIKTDKEPDTDDSQVNGVMQAEPDPDDSLETKQRISRTQTDEPNPDDQELQIIQDPVTIICARLQKAIEMLLSEVNPSEAAGVLQTLFKIIRNLIEHPSEIKFKRIRKANPIIQRNVSKYKAAMEILFLIGFIEDVVSDEIGRPETYLVLKRNDPGLLWLAKSSLETCIAC